MLNQQAFAAVINATYASATTVPVTAAGYTATGNTVDFTLSYAPATGTTLTVVQNTSLAFISGTFSNLAQGQTVAMTHAGLTYFFTANYFGGTGNDLVLQWAGTEVYGWGWNGEGELGNGNTSNGLVPMALPSFGALAGKTVTAISVGGEHTLALCSDGTLVAWGDNTYGQLGDGSMDKSLVPVAVKVTGPPLAGKTVIAIAAGGGHSLALCSDGTLAAWGLNNVGQLGNSSTSNRPEPIAVLITGTPLAGKTVVAVSAGGFHNLALCSDGTLAAWGYNAEGALGNNSTVHSLQPVAVTVTGTALAGKTLLAVTAGSFHNLALCSDGTVAAWGRGLEGQLGNNSVTNRLVPTAVSVAGTYLAGKTVISVSSGGLHSLALCSDGTVAAWGAGSDGQLGNNSTANTLTPVAVSVSGTALAGKSVSTISAGGGHSLALCSDGTLAAWGANSDGELGSNGAPSSTIPVAVSMLALPVDARFAAAVSGSTAAHSFAFVARPAVPTVTTTSPTAITATTAALGGEVTANGAASVIERGIVWATTAAPTISNNKVPNGSGFGSFSGTVSGFPAAAVIYARAYATNVVGTGYGREIRFITSEPSPLNANYTSATVIPKTADGYTATGNTVNLTLSYAPDTGTALMVVQNTSRDFITGPFNNLAQGQTVALIYGGVTYNFVANYFGGTGNDLVLQWAGIRVFSWGYNSSGQLGNNSTAKSIVPVAVNVTGTVLAGKNIIAISSGSSHNLALCSDGTVASWGSNGSGQLGNNSTTQSNVPVAVSVTGTALAGRTVIAVSAGGGHSLALCSDGTVVSWGGNGSGQLGNNSTVSSSVAVAVSTAGTVLAGKTVTAIAAGSGHNLVLCSDGTVAAWGGNNIGQLGINSTTQRLVPVAVRTADTALMGKVVVALDAGANHSLALCSDGTIAAWGYNSSGQLGNNSTVQSNVPAAVSVVGTALTGKFVIAVSVGESHNLALCSDGTLAAWGANTAGKLGNNSTTQSNVPVAVSVAPGTALAGKSIISISTAYYHSLALCSDGTLAAWGWNGNGELGNNTTAQSLTPVAVSASTLPVGGRFSGADLGATATHGLGLVATPAAYEPSVTTTAQAAITATTAVLGGAVISDGAASVTEHGIVWAATPTPTITNNKVQMGSGTSSFGSTVTGLPSGTLIYVRAYAINVVGTGYGSEISFHTSAASPLNASYTSASDVPVASPGYTATGNTVSFTLNYAPTTGTTLMVVKNTSLDFTIGPFSNLAQGQAVALSHGGATYQFVANYFGGSGNDLVLQWADTRVFAWGDNSANQVGNDSVGQMGNNNTRICPLPTMVPLTGVLTGKTVLTVSAGLYHNLALCSDGTLAAWGSNSYGQLGNNSTTRSAVPVAVRITGAALAGKTVIAVAAGAYFSLALCSDGTVAAWGENDRGQLGNNSTNNSLVPTAVSSAGTALEGKTVIGLSSGVDHSLALCSDGTVAAWGYNWNGQLGNNGTSSSLVPVAVSIAGTALAGKAVVAVSAGELHNLALCSDGTLVSWGTNNNGQLGIGSTSNRLVPTAVSVAGTALAGKSVVSVSAGRLHSLVLCSDGTVATWGYNFSGQLGNNSTTNTLVAVGVAGAALAGKTVSSISTGQYHSVALCSDGTLAAWGQNERGQLGDNTLTNSSVPISVSTLPFPGGSSLMAAVSGSNAFHHFGFAAVPATPTVATSTPSTVTATTAVLGGNVTAVGGASVSERGIVWAIAPTPTIGSNKASMGSGTGTFSGTVTALPASTLIYVRAYATSVVGTAYGSEISFITPAASPLNATFSSAADVPVTAVGYTAAGNSVNLALNYAPATGTTLMVVKNTSIGFIRGPFSNLAQGQTVALNHGGVTYRFLANYYGGTGNDLVLHWADRRLFGWGANDNGQLGNNRTFNSPLPAEVQTTGVLTGKTVLAVAVGGSHSLALCSDGTIAAWGGNVSGQLGNNSTTDSPIPVAVRVTGTALAGKAVIAIAAGTSHSLALCSDGTLAAWGNNGDGQLGNNSTLQSQVPVTVGTAGTALAGKNVIAVVAGRTHNLVLCIDGTLAVWGNNDDGQLGINSRSDSLVPVAVNIVGTALAGRSVTSISTGGRHSVAICSDGTLAAWGDNIWGQLGNGSTNDALVPVVINTASTALVGKSVTAISAGLEHTLALSSDGFLAAWGWNNSGQLGNNSMNNSSLPIAVPMTGVLAGKTVLTASAGSYHSLALCSDGTLASWGWDTAATNLVPVAVSTSTLPFDARFVAAMSGSVASHSFGFAAVPATPTVTTSTPSTVTATTAVLGGNVTAIGGASVSERGIVWAIAPAPTISSNKASMSSGTGTFSGTVTGLPASTLIFARAYATNAVGTSYGREVSFITPTSSPLNAIFNSAADVPVTAEGYTAAGNSVNLTLNYAPATGTTLMVVKNTSIGFISGPFSNLAHGQRVALSYGGANYSFIANYYGGTGNDLVLQWADRRMFTWGYNNKGQLGNNSTVSSLIPVLPSSAGVLAGKTVMTIAAGASHSLALCSDGTLAAWGSNSFGQLGNNSTTDSLVPVAVNIAGTVLAGKTVRYLWAGYDTSMALCSDGTLAAWGSDGWIQFSNPSSSRSLLPLLVNFTNTIVEGKTIIAISAGPYHTLALCSDGTVAAWGSNTNGQLGNNTTSDSSIPVAVSVTGTALVGKTVVDIVAGDFFSLALCSDGTLAAWGDNIYGELGNNSTTDSRVPVAVSVTSTALTGKTVTAISAGKNHCLALCSDGTLASWGGNYYGQLGNTGSNTGVPVAVSIAGTALAGKIVTAISAGSYNGQALCSDGTLAAWGYNGSGQLGNNSTIDSLLPVAVGAGSLPFGAGFVSAVSGLSSFHSLGLVAMPPAPDIAVSQSSALTDGVGSVDFGMVALGSSSNARTFTITNPGNADLTSLAITGGTSEFVVGALSGTTVSSSGNATFTVTFTPNASGARSTTLRIASNVVGAKNPFDITLTGTGQTVFQAWAAANGTAPGNATLPNFAFGTAPGSNSALVYSGQISGSMSISATGGPIAVPHPLSGPLALFIRRKDHVTAGLIYTPQFSSNLGAWVNSSDTPTVLSDNGVYQLLGVPFPPITSGQTGSFFRVQLTVSP